MLGTPYVEPTTHFQHIILATAEKTVGIGEFVSSSAEDGIHILVCCGH
jgi:hypothetical protein